MEKRVAQHMAVQSEAAESMQRARLLLEQASKRRKRKKRRKKKLPKTSSSRSSCASHAARTRISGRSSTHPLYLAVLFGVMVLPEEFFGVFPYSAIPWFYSGYSTCVSRRCFWLLFHISLCEGGPRLQRSILAATCPHGCLQARDACVMAGMDQRESYLARVWQRHVQCWVLLVFLHLTLCFLLVVRPLILVGRPAGRSASWPVWTRRTVTSCRAENCGKSAVGVHQQGRLHSCRFAEVDPLV